MFTFKKEERLSSRKVIGELFKSGKALNSGIYRVVWLPLDVQNVFPAQVVISVPKRSFKKAVDRNRIKRLIKEAYRKNKNALYDTLNGKQKKIAFIIAYTAKEELPYAEIESKLIITLQRLQTVLEKDN